METDNDQPFPIHDLPLDLEYKVLPRLSAFDLYNLSHVSDESKNLVKGYVGNKNYRLQIAILRPYNYVIRLRDSDGDGFTVCFCSYWGFEANSEFNFGEFSVPSKNDWNYCNMYVTLTARTGWDHGKAARSLITHLTDVFTKDVCISTVGWMIEQKKIVMGLVESQNLLVHCYKDDEEHDLSNVDEVLKYPRRCLEVPKNTYQVNTNQLKRLLEEWRTRENTRHLEIGDIPEVVAFDELMRGYTLESANIDNGHMYTYSLTKTSGVRATVKVIDGYRHHTRWGRGWTSRYVPGKLVISVEAYPKFLPCFDD